MWKDKLIDNTWRRIFPKNKWARKIIPHTYSDKVELIKDFLFASIVDFIENEPIGYTDWESSEIHSDAFKRINKCYAFIKKEMSKSRNEVVKVKYLALNSNGVLDNFLLENTSTFSTDKIKNNTRICSDRTS